MAYQTVRQRRLEKVLTQIKAHPETWTQRSWECGTSACFCGWARRFSKGFGKSPKVYYNFPRLSEALQSFDLLPTKILRLKKLLYVLVKSKSFWNYFEYEVSRGWYYTITDRMVLFGAFYFRLPVYVANELFKPDNKLEDLESLTYHVINSFVFIPPPPEQERKEYLENCGYK